jgi:NADPH:quinone reductase-like Zn-dependent oxidoreductase
MKAIVQDRYGSPDALVLSEIDRPTTGDDEVLVRVRAASVHADVWHAMRGQPYVLRILGSGLRKPKSRVPGTDMAGHVESVGTKVTRFRPGDEVFGHSFVGNLWRHGGALAEFAAVPEYRLERKPARITVRTGRDRAHLRIARGAGCPRRGTDPAGTETRVIVGSEAWVASPS